MGLAAGALLAYLCSVPDVSGQRSLYYRGGPIDLPRAVAAAAFVAGVALALAGWLAR